MKLDENKHDHKLTNWIKVGIFALLMLAPMFASISQTLYVTFNRNAYQSYSDTYITTYDNVTSANVLQNNEQYSINLLTYIENTGQYTRLAEGSFIYDNISVNWNDYIKRDVDKLTPQQLSDIKQIQIAFGTGLILEFDDVNGTNIKRINTSNVTQNDYFTNLGETIYFTLQGIGTFNLGSYTKLYSSNAMYKISKTIDKLDNAFYYGVDQMTKSDLFNWTQNTALYTGINAMTTQLEIQTPAIAILLTYWFILTIIYVIIDIVLKGFTLLTHMFSNKV